MRNALNPILQYIVAFDFFVIGALAFLSPVFAVFVVEEIRGASVATVGIAVAIYWIVKSVLQIKVAAYIDKKKGEYDDFLMLVSGVTSAAIAMILFTTATEVAHIFVIQGLYGVAMALLTPPYYAIFTRHVDKGKEAMQWAIRSSVSFGGGSAIGAAVGGIIAEAYGFDAVFLTIGILLLISILPLLPARAYLNGQTKGPQPPEHT